jgi:hypothetical protein
MSLTKLLEDLRVRNHFRVEAFGLSGTWMPVPSLVIRGVGPAETNIPSRPFVAEFAYIDIDLGHTLPEPVLVGTHVDLGALQAVPGFDQAALTWELLVPRG